MSFFITHWYGIRPDFISRERLVEAAEAGFTTIECRYDTATNLRVLDWCRQLGLNAFVWDDRMQAAIDEAPGWEQTLNGMIADYAGHPALDRFFVRDEPYASHFPMLARIAQYLRGRGQKFYVNLYPLHGLPNEDYNEHVSAFVDMTQPDLLSYDHYCMRKRPVSAERRADADFWEARVSPAQRERNGDADTIFEAYDSVGYFKNMELIRRHAHAYGLPWMIIILLSEHWDYRCLTEAELRWEVFTALAYGTDALSYFTYWTPGRAHKEPWTYQNAIINADGTRNENYWRVKRINAQLTAMVRAIDGARSLAVFHVGGDPDAETVPFTGYGDIHAIDGAPLVAGFFEEGLCVLANKDYRADRTVTLTCSAPLRQYSPDRDTWDMLRAADGRYTINIHAGDGVLLRAGTR